METNINDENLVAQLKELQKKRDEFFTEYATWPQNDSDAFWKVVSERMDAHLMTIIQLAASESHENGVDLFTIQKETCIGIRVIEAILSFLIDVTTLGPKVYVPPDMIRTIDNFKVILSGLPDDAYLSQKRIVDLFVSCWRNGFLNKYEYGMEALDYFFRLSFIQIYKEVAIKEVNKLREVFIYHFNTEHKTDTKNKIEQCILNQGFLSQPQGRKFLANVFKSSPSAARGFHGVVIDVFTDLNKQNAALLGSVYYTSWKTAEEDIKKTLEEDCIQNLMFWAIILDREHQGKSCDAMLALLNVFHKNGTEKDTARMLCKCYLPILWRHLKVANPYIRQNATVLLFDCFPLTDPDIKMEAKEIELNNQFRHMELMLSDTNKDVRTRATTGFFNMAVTHWDILPIAFLQSSLKVVIRQLKCSRSSKECESIIMGIQHLMINPSCHTSIKYIMPKIKDSFHDVVESVRVSFIDLLAMATKENIIKFLDVLPYDHILARLSDDTSKLVIYKISKLISLDYFSPYDEDDALIAKGIELNLLNPSASNVFYANLIHFARIEDIGRYMMAASNYLGIYATNRLENEEEEEENILKKPKVVLGIIGNICILFNSLLSKFEKYQNEYKNLSNDISSVLPVLLKYFCDGEIFKYVIYLASFLSLDQCPVVPSMCISRIKKLEEMVAEDQLLPFALHLCSQNKTNYLLELIADWLTVEPDTDQSQPPNKKKVKFANSERKKPLFAIRLLRTLLRNPTCHSSILSDQREEYLSEIYCSLENIKTSIPSQLKENPAKPFPTELMKEAFALYLELTILKTNLNPNCHFYDILDWATDNITDIVCNEDSLLKIQINSSQSCSSDFESISNKCKYKSTLGSRNKEKRNLDQQNKTAQEVAMFITERILETMCDVFLIRKVEEISLPIFGNYLLILMGKKLGTTHMKLFTSIFHNAVEFILLQDPIESKENVKFVVCFFSGIFRRLFKDSIHFPDEFKKNIKPVTTIILRKDILKISKCLKLKDPMLHEITSDLMGVCISEISIIIKKSEVPVKPVKLIQDLPIVTSTVLTFLASHKNLLNSFLNNIVECLREEFAVEEPVGCFSITYLVYAIYKDDCTKMKDDESPMLKDLLLAIKDCLRKIYSNLQNQDENETQNKNDTALLKLAGSLVKNLKKVV